MRIRTSPMPGANGEPEASSSPLADPGWFGWHSLAADGATPAQARSGYASASMPVLAVTSPLSGEPLRRRARSNREPRRRPRRHAPREASAVGPRQEGTHLAQRRQGVCVLRRPA